MPQVAAISQQIWDMKYRLKDAGGGAVDRTIEDSWRRVATTLAAPEKDPVLWAERFYEAMTDFKFLPAGRILAGAGTKRNVTLFNGFVMGTIPDDMSGIFEHLREAALTMQQGGGIGYDFSTLRPKGAPVKGVLTLEQEEKRVDTRHGESRRGVSREGHVQRLLKRHRVQHAGDRIHVGDAPVDQIESGGSVHPGVRDDHEHPRRGAADGHENAGPEVRPWGDAIPAVEIDAEEDCLREEGESLE